MRQAIARSQLIRGRSVLVPFSFRLAGTACQQRVAIVTGGSSGIGRAISKALADGGDKVVVADIAADKGREVAESIDGSFVHCDVTDSSAIEGLIKEVAAAHGSVDVVVTSAGIAPAPSAVHTISDEDWHRMVSINGFGTFVTVKHALRQMLKQESGGVILGMSSIAGLRPPTGLAAYNFTKAGIVSLTKTVAIEYRLRNIRMNCLCPSVTETEMVRAYYEAAPPEVKEASGNVNPVPGLLQPHHVAHAATMLCAPNKYMTGVALPIDGGFTACAPTYKLSDYVELAEQQAQASQG